MANNIDNGHQKKALDWLMGVGSPTRPTTPLKVRLMTANGDDHTNGTEVTNSGGSTYASLSLTVGAAASDPGATSNSGDLNFTNMPACTVTGLEVWDSAGTPVRVWFGALASNKTLSLGDTFELPAAALTFAID